MSKFYEYANLDEFLSWSKVAIDNAIQSPEILAALSIYGYDEVSLQEGSDLRETVVDLESQQNGAYGKQFAATQAFEQAWRETDRRHYAVHRRLVRLAYKKDKDRREALRLNERKKQSYGGWYHQAETFYRSLLNAPDVVETLARFNLTREQLEQAQGAVEQVGALKAEQEQQKTAAQQATQARDVALGALKEWLSAFREVARIALADDPEHLETIQLAMMPVSEIA